MPNDKIYNDKETPMLAEIKDETLRAKLDEICEGFLAAKSLEDELGKLYAEAIEYLDSAKNSENAAEINSAMQIMEAVHMRAAVSIILKENLQIYEDEEVEKLATITDKSVRHVLNAHCAKFLEAKSLDELEQLYREAQDALTNSIDETNVMDAFQASKIMDLVNGRAAAKIVSATSNNTESPTEPEKA